MEKKCFGQMNRNPKYLGLIGECLCVVQKKALDICTVPTVKYGRGFVGGRSNNLRRKGRSGHFTRIERTSKREGCSKILQRPCQNFAFATRWWPEGPLWTMSRYHIQITTTTRFLSHRTSLGWPRLKSQKSISILCKTDLDIITKQMGKVWRNYFEQLNQNIQSVRR